MTHAEAMWFHTRLASLRDDQIFPLLNIGSSTLEFRSKVQPFIHEEIFQPLAARGGAVHHIDIKAAEGVDIVGDLDDEQFCDRLRELKPRSVMVSNLLEHVKAPTALAQRIVDPLPPGGLMLVSGPHRYPYHADPIDNGFRPNVEQIAMLFPQMDLVEGEILEAGQWDRGGRTLGRLALRLALPIHRPGKWWELARQVPWAWRQISAFAAVLQKKAVT